MWRFPLKRKSKQSTNKDPKAQQLILDDSQDSGLGLQPSHTGSTLATDSTESNHRQLTALVQRMRAAPTGTNQVDAAYKVYTKIKDNAATLCYAIMQDEIKPTKYPSISFGPDTQLRRESSYDTPQSPVGAYDQRSSFSGRSLSEVFTSTGSKSIAAHDSWLAAIREWKNCIEVLHDTHKTSLAETYKSYERDATPEMVDTLFSNKKFRKEAVHRMRNASVTRVMSADPQFFPKYEIRFRNYERVKEDLRETRNLLLAAESGIAPDRKVAEYPIATKGDVILEFANLTAEATGDEPVLRFRVSSQRLADTSPLFARMFSGHHSSLHVHDDEDITSQLPPPPSRYVCRDGFEARLYRMPQYELNHLESLEILLHAAHMHNDDVPREVSFEKFVAIAECCLLYKCTSPLELVVEHLWLPKWMHQGADDMPDGLLVISYAFGLRQLFTRISKSAMLNLVDEKDLMSKPWPKRIRDKLWAVRCAKVDQLYACCMETIKDYIKTPSPDAFLEDSDTLPPPDQHGNWLPLYTATNSTASLTTATRCPKGSHWCDASNLGWMMLVFNEIGLLSQMLNPAVTSHFSGPSRPSRSLAQLFTTLRRVPNPTAPIHRGGVCDPCPAFRSALNDIYNSVSGLTLYDVSGKSHGWALSKHKEGEPQTHFMTGLKRMAAKDPSHSVATEFPETVRLKVLSQIDNLDDLHSAAMTNWAFYETYKTHELYLMRTILRNDRIRSGTQRRPVVVNHRMAEEKFRKIEADHIRSHVGRLAADAMTLGSDDEDDSEFDDDASVIDTPAPSISEGAWRSREPTAEEDGDGSPNRWLPGYPSCRRSSGAMSVEAASSPTTPRQRSPQPPVGGHPPPSKPHVVCNEFAKEAPMTHEEAQRILWPDEFTQKPRFPAQTVPPGVEGLREKFLAGDTIFNDALEAKSLVLTGERQLRSERIGVSEEDAGAVSSGSSKAQGGSQD
ncbi:hypothetical protein LIA77_01713 [Sarocladium implicatum]|nr:hypothetical protein LIA77_01713 [Sarocladium implicatum]